MNKSLLIFKTYLKNINYVTISILTIIFIIVISLMNYIHDSKVTQLTEDIKKRDQNILEHIDMLKAGISQDNDRRWKILGISKYITKVNSNISYELSYSYAEYIVNSAEINPKIDPFLISSVIKQESHFINNSRSIKDAIGLMQVTIETGKWICKEMGISYYDGILNNPEMNIKIGSWFLNYLMVKYENNETLVLAHYNGGYLQKNNYINRIKLAHTKEYKSSTIESLNKKINDLEDILISKGVNDFYSSSKYIRLKELLSAKRFSKETEEYIPSVQAYKKIITEFVSNSFLIS